MQQAPNSHSPFLLGNTQAYENWKKQKLIDYPQKAEQLIIAIKNPLELSFEEISQLQACLNKSNMVIYDMQTGDVTSKELAFSIGKQLGISELDKNECADEDSFSSIMVQHEQSHNYYIPYTNKPLNWHTDGYYNSLDTPIRSMLLHCAQPALQGGENQLFDHEIAYILLREQNPVYIDALMQPDAMTIPENIRAGKLLREARPGPVFSIDKDGNLHMRYSARARNIVWKDDAITPIAAKALIEILQNPSPYHFILTLQSGQGLICRNVLHTRSEFIDDDKHPRLLYRGRYLDRV